MTTMHRSLAIILVFFISLQVYAQPENLVRVLIIGNSLTYYNNMPAILEGVASNSNTAVESQMVVMPGAMLQDHWNGTVAKAAISEGDWDFVILQEVPLLGSLTINGKMMVQDRAYFHHYVRLFVDHIRTTGSQPILLLPWPRQKHPEHLEQMIYAHMEIGRELEVPVVPAGFAWEKVVQSAGPMLYMQDGVHPTPAGTYLTSIVIYSTLIGHHPSDVPIRIEGHPIDRRGKVIAKSLDVLVQMTKEESTKLMNAATETAQHIREKGGYIDVPIPAIPDLPQLPEGYPAEATTITGVWRGPIRLVPALTEMQLTITEQDGKIISTWELLFEKEQYNQTAVVENFRTLENQIRFTISGLRVMPGVTEYRGVMRGDKLVGIAELLAHGGQMHMVGTWELTRQNGEK